MIEYGMLVFKMLMKLMKLVPVVLSSYYYFRNLHAKVGIEN